LRHWTLAYDFAGNNEVESVFLHPLIGMSNHEAFAIQAGVEIRTVTMFGIDYDIFIFLYDIDDMQLDSQLLRYPQRVVAFRLGAVFMPDSMGMAFHAKPGKEIDTFYVDALIKNGFRGQHGIQTTGN